FWATLSNLWNRGQIEQGRPLLATAEELFFNGWAVDRRQDLGFEPFDLTPLTSPIGDAFDRQSLNQANRDRILPAPSHLFNRKGIDSTTLEEIAAAINATPRALYHNIGDKKTVVAECYFRTLRMAIHLQTQANARPGSKLLSGTAFQHAWARAQMRS